MSLPKNLREEERLMRREIRELYRREKARLKEKCRTELATFLRLIGAPLPVDPPKRSRGEEIANAVSHGIGALLSAFAFALMLSHAVSVAERVGAIVYFSGLFLMFSSSCLYHAFRHGGALKRLFRRFDYASVYVLIGATFCPILLNLAGGEDRGVFLALQWGVIILGVTFVFALGPARFVAAHVSLYLLLGWSALLIIPFLRVAGDGFLAFTLIGGVIYTLGVIPCAVDKRATHFVWHLFVLAGAAVQCVGVIKYIYLK